MKKKAALLLSSLLLLTLSLTACGAASKHLSESNSASVAESSWTSSAESGGGILWDAEYSPAFAESPVYSDPDAKVIRTAELVIQTTEFDQSTAALAALTEEQGGYYESARVDGGAYNRYTNRSASYVVRIPKEHFTAFRDKAGEVGYLYSMTENSDDVGEIYYDTEARLAVQETKRDRLLALLEQAERMEDIISLENALADVQYEIDMYNTTLRKYDSLIDYSTFHIELMEVTRISAEPTPEDGFFTKLGASFLTGFEGFAAGAEGLALWLARNLIGLMILAVIVVIVVRISLRHYKKRRTGQSEKE